MSSVLWAKTQQLQEDAFRQLQNIYGEKLKYPPSPSDFVCLTQTFYQASPPLTIQCWESSIIFPDV